MYPTQYSCSLIRQTTAWALNPPQTHAQTHSSLPSYLGNAQATCPHAPMLSTPSDDKTDTTCTPHQCDKGQGTKTATLSVPHPLQKEVMNLKFRKDAAGWRAGKVCSKRRKQKKITFLGRLEDLWHHLKSVRTEICLELCRQRETFIWTWGWFHHLMVLSRYFPTIPYQIPPSLPALTTMTWLWQTERMEIFSFQAPNPNCLSFPSPFWNYCSEHSASS